MNSKINVILCLVSNSSTHELNENTGYHISNPMSERVYLVEYVRLKSLEPLNIIINMLHVCSFLFCKCLLTNVKKTFRESSPKDKHYNVIKVVINICSIEQRKAAYAAAISFTLTLSRDATKPKLF